MPSPNWAFHPGGMISRKKKSNCHWISFRHAYCVHHHLAAWYLTVQSSTNKRKCYLTLHKLTAQHCRNWENLLHTVSASLHFLRFLTPNILNIFLSFCSRFADYSCSCARLTLPMTVLTTPHCKLCKVNPPNDSANRRCVCACDVWGGEGCEGI